MKPIRRDALVFAILLLCCVLTAWLGIAGPIIEALPTASPGDWLTFTGSLLTSLMTLAAAWIAWVAVQRQIERADLDRERAKDETKLAAVMAMTQSIHAAAATLKAVRWEQNEADGGQKLLAQRAVKRGLTYIEGTLKNFALQEIAGGLRVNDRALFIGIISTLNTVVDLSKTEDVLRDLKIQSLEGALSNVAVMIRAFDEELADKFQADATL